MVVPIETLLTWVVASSVTFGGIILAQRIAEGYRRRREDRISIFEPLSRDLNVLAHTEERVSLGERYRLSEREVWQVTQSGILIPKRHDTLLRDFERLRILDEALEAALTGYLEERYEAVEKVLRDLQVTTEGGKKVMLKDVPARIQGNHDLLRWLTAEDEERWVEGFSRHLSDKLRADPTQVAGEFFRRALEQTRGTRQRLDDAAKAFTVHVRMMKGRLEAALRRGTNYRDS